MPHLQPMEGLGILTACGAELVPLLVVIGLFLWGRRVAARHGGRSWQLLSYLPIVALVVQHLGIGVTVLMLIDAFQTVANVGPEARSSVLASGIASAMWPTAIAIALSGLLYVVCIVAFAMGTWRAPTERR